MLGAPERNGTIAQFLPGACQPDRPAALVVIGRFYLHKIATLERLERSHHGGAIHAQYLGDPLNSPVAKRSNGGQHAKLSVVDLQLAESRGRRPRAASRTECSESPLRAHRDRIEF